MTESNFCYWLQGFIELTGGERPSAAQWQAIGDHLQTVFKKVTPDRVGSQLGITSSPATSPITTLEHRLTPSQLGTVIC